MTPRLSVGTTYSDNIQLAPSGEEEGDTVLQVDPGISVRKQGGRLNLRLDYTAQACFTPIIAMQIKSTIICWYLEPLSFIKITCFWMLMVQSTKSLLFPMDESMSVV